MLGAAANSDWLIIPILNLAIDSIRSFPLVRLLIRLRILHPKQLAIEYNIKFMETSAKSSYNIEEAFISLARDIKTKMEQRMVSNLGIRLKSSIEELD